MTAGNTEVPGHPEGSLSVDFSVEGNIPAEQGLLQDTALFRNNPIRPMSSIRPFRINRGPRLRGTRTGSSL